MIGTLFGILIALFLFYNPVSHENDAILNVLVPVFIIVSIFLILIENIAFILSWRPLQKASLSITPHLINYFKKDRYFKFINGWLFVFALATLFIAINISNFSQFDRNILIGTWIILFGFSFDCLQYSLKRVLNYLNPFAVIDMVKNEGVKNIQNEKEIDLCDQVDALYETAVNGAQNQTPFLTNYALSAIQNLSRIFLESSRSISHQESDSQTKAFGIQDKVTYTLSYFFQRIKEIFQIGLKNDLETVLNSSVAQMGKITLDCAKYDISLCLHPITLLGSFAVKSIDHHFPDVGVRATCTLSEVAKEIVKNIDLSYLEIQETFLCLIGQLEHIAKETFKKDKNNKIMILAQPFLELKELFKEEKIANHQDTPVILKDIDRVIGELQILDNVMRTMPKIQPIEK